MLSCNLFPSNYPLLIEHISREARLYRSHLLALEGKKPEGCQEPLGGEAFWNQIMMEHALFIQLASRSTWSASRGRMMERI